jgi:hypothetical protein
MNHLAITLSLPYVLPTDAVDASHLTFGYFINFLSIQKSPDQTRIA